ncbi:MAG: hypothetical protein ACRCYV_06930, partial [Aeromonas sp.]
MQKVIGVKSVDFKIKALGHGVVNWNGPTTLTGDDGKTVDNHTLPKLRGYTNLTGKVKDETGYKYKKQATDINFKETPLYISQNCIRHHLFREQAFDLHFASEKNLKNILASITGLIPGREHTLLKIIESINVEQPRQRQCSKFKLLTNCVNTKENHKWSIFI